MTKQVKIIILVLTIIVLGAVGWVIYLNSQAEKDFVEKGALSEAEARAIAEKSCIKGGKALSAGYYNENSKTWWFDANLNATREGCNPACVVSEETKTAEINWRCTGLIVPKNNGR